MQTRLNLTIFKVYDIRDIVGKTIDAEIARLIGRVLGSVAHIESESAVVIGRSDRSSGSGLLAALADGLRASGIDVIDLDLVATPMIYFGTSIELVDRRVTSSVMVTGSHNPPDCSGFKIVLVGRAIYGEQT